MSKILLLGGSGFLGSAMRRAFSEDPAYETFYTSTHDNAADPSHLTLDLLQERDAEKVKTFDVIVNLTGQITKDFSQCLALNTQGMQNLIRAVGGGTQRIIQVSSVQVYGTAGEVTESSPLQPDSPYASAKANAEALLQSSLSEERFLIARLCNVYGPGQAKGLMWFLLDRIKKGQDITIGDNDGSLFRHFLHADDAAQMLYDLIACEAAGIVNVAGPEAYTIKDLVALCEKIAGRTLRVSYADAHPLGNIDSISTKKLASLVPVHLRHTVEEYLRKELL